MERDLIRNAVSYITLTVMSTRTLSILSAGGKEKVLDSSDFLRLKERDGGVRKRWRR